jgi:hypothetical protein
MADDDKQMKSAYELAMERLKRDDEGEPLSLTEVQKRELAEIEREVTAKIAEQEILLKSRIVAALAAGNVDEAGKVRDELAEELRRIRERGEARKDAVRRGDRKSEAPESGESE